MSASADTVSLAVNIRHASSPPFGTSLAGLVPAKRGKLIYQLELHMVQLLYHVFFTVVKRM